ncbi:MAG: hypothetical protein HQM01_15440 [Magnetococcales bacterium]|nr:hypothetical protein [Magnetococcales bacterium]
MSSTQWSLIGEGKIFIGLRSGGKMRHVGQVKEFKLEVSEETKELKNYEGGGGLADSVSFISKVEASFTFASLSTKNLAMALRGVDAPVTSTVVANQAQTAYAGGFVPLDGIGPTSVAVSVAPNAWQATTVYSIGALVKPSVGTHFYRCKSAGTTGAAEPTWKTDGTDTTDGTIIWQDMGTMALAAGEFEINSAGIYIPEGSAKISATGTPIQVSYTTTAGVSIQTLVSAGDEYRIIFAGTNFARAGKPLSVEMHRVKFSPPKDLSFIGDDFASLTLTGTVLKDDTRTGVDISAFCAIKMVEE